jgi:hypothetical protein
MTRKLKALGLAFVAILALGVLSASAASAAEIHSEQAHTIIDGSQPVAEDDVYTFNAGTVKCTEASYSGTTTSATSSEVSLTPAYSGCTAFGFVNAKIDIEIECTFRLRWGIPPFRISCTKFTIKITAFNCHVSMGTQDINSGVTYDNAGSGSSRDITATLNLSGIKYTQESKSFPGCTNGTFTNGTYKGSITLTGTNTVGGAVGIWST